MTGFRVRPPELTEYAREISEREPFSGLAAEARRIEAPRAATASSVAIERFTDRLARELTGLATATGSLGHATRSAAAGYQEVDDSIGSMSTP
jgi:hypothetical protein